jgi:hypothetical protein
MKKSLSLLALLLVFMSCGKDNTTAANGISQFTNPLQTVKNNGNAQSLASIITNNSFAGNGFVYGDNFTYTYVEFECRDVGENFERCYTISNAKKLKRRDIEIDAKQKQNELMGLLNTAISVTNVKARNRMMPFDMFGNPMMANSNIYQIDTAIGNTYFIDTNESLKANPVKVYNRNEQKGYKLFDRRDRSDTSVLQSF